MPEAIFAEASRSVAKKPETTVRPIGIAILAMGGEGGGVLADWIVDMAEHEGFPAQSTSVPGVAQRTGTTVYYVEFLPQVRDKHQIHHQPVLALMPVAGDVDIVIASELMEMGRAVQRGLVTPSKTTLIASTNRVYSMTEKTAMGDGRVDPEPFLKAATEAARRIVTGDFASIADRSGSVISAALFGALAGTEALPFSREQFEAAVRRAGVGVDSSLKAFAQGYDTAQRKELPKEPAEIKEFPPSTPAVKKLDERIQVEFPATVAFVLRSAVRRLTDYQDARYAGQYLHLLHRFRDLDTKHGDGSMQLLNTVARYLALWMTYEDTARVADLKIRATRFNRVRDEVQVKGDQVMRINEYFHPRVEEIADTLPSWLGRLILRPGMLNELLRNSTSKGRVIRTTSVSGYLLLYTVAGMRSWRRASLRFEREHEEIEKWLNVVASYVPTNYELATEIAECQRLVKGYGDTHARGMRNFGKIMAVVPKAASQSGGATCLRQLRDAALKDEEGKELERVMQNWQL